jgi:hypothetical protein
VAAQLLEADVILPLSSLPLKAADKFIVGILPSNAIGLSKMEDHKLLTLR